jgi:hypothetical protein
MSAEVDTARRSVESASSALSGDLVSISFGRKFSIRSLFRYFVVLSGRHYLTGKPILSKAGTS